MKGNPLAATWSPDGKLIAFLREHYRRPGRGGQIWTMRPDGSHRRHRYTLGQQPYRRRYRLAPALTLVLHQHPFASYCQKVLIALYELGVPFESHLVEGAEGRAELARLWPMATIPVLRRRRPDPARVDDDHRVRRRLGRWCRDLQARLWDRFVDKHISTPMQKIVGDELRPGRRKDPEGVGQARGELDTAYGVLDARLADRPGPAATRSRRGLRRVPGAVLPARHPPLGDDANITRYYRDLLARPTITRVVEEARPYRELFPQPWPPDQDDL